ncbi:MAG: hypothetical protein ABSG43_15290 [Solirubrobacteraceae bacterium]
MYERARDHPQRLVAGVVTEAVVDLLEAIDVDEQDSERAPQALVLLHPPQQRRLPEATIAHAGKRI